MEGEVKRIKQKVWHKESRKKIMAGILPHIPAMIIKWMHYTHLLIDRCSDCLKPSNSRSCYILFKRDIPETK